MRGFWHTWIGCVGLLSCSDSSVRYLNAGDVIFVTPNVVVLAPPQGNSGPENERVLTVRATRGEGVTAEGFHVDVCLGSSCAAPGRLNGMLSATDFLSLGVVSVENSDCSRISDALLHCVLSTYGTAEFLVRAKHAFSGIDGIAITPSSGSSSAATAATVAVGYPLPSDAVLSFAPDLPLLPATRLGLACGAQEGGACDSPERTRSTPVVVQARSALSRASDLRSTFVDAEIALSIAPQVPGGKVWLAKRNGDCISSSATQMQTIMKGATGQTDNVYVCSDGTNGTYTLTAAPIASGPPSSSVDVRVAAQPARVRAAKNALFDKRTGEMSVVLRISDCREERVGGVQVEASPLLSALSSQTATTSADVSQPDYGEAVFKFTIDPVTLEGASVVLFSVKLPESQSSCNAPLAVPFEVVQ